MSATSPRSLQAVVFDFDGVLADTEPLHLRAFQQALEPLGVALEPTDYYARYLGYDDHGVFGVLARDRQLGWSDRDVAALVRAKAASFRAVLDTHRVLFDGVGDAVRAWAEEVPIAIASGALREEIEFILRGAGLLDLFSFIVAAGETPQGKPAPDPYRAVLEGLRAEPARTVAVEDSLGGIESAHGAGMKVVAVTTSYNLEQLAEADAVVAGVANLTLKQLDELARR